MWTIRWFSYHIMLFLTAVVCRFWWRSSHRSGRPWTSAEAVDAQSTVGRGDCSGVRKSHRRSRRRWWRQIVFHGIRTRHTQSARFLGHFSHQSVGKRHKIMTIKNHIKLVMFTFITFIFISLKVVCTIRKLRHNQLSFETYYYIIIYW